MITGLEEGALVPDPNGTIIVLGPYSLDTWNVLFDASPLLRVLREIGEPLTEKQWLAQKPKAST